ncbi:hypothetical protein WS68_16940 [Burkholderia sp. TSV86]|nr:hypothetical protein WS68_16940 [Burkholderia sp. TSV86]
MTHGDRPVASYQSRKLTKQLQLTTSDQVIAMNIRDNDKSRRWCKHTVDSRSALRNEAAALGNGTRMIDAYPARATTW